MGIIYKATNRITGKSYVGQSKTTLERRIISHKHRASKEKINTHFYNSIKKHGFNNFEWEILEEVDNKKLCNKEEYYIKNLNTVENGYNMTYGGKVTKITPEIRKKLTESQINRFKKKTERNKISKLQSKWFIIENIKTKESFLIFGLINFCKKYNLSYHSMKKISQGMMNIHKKEWTNVRRLEC